MGAAEELERQKQAQAREEAERLAREEQERQAEELRRAEEERQRLEEEEMLRARSEAERQAAAAIDEVERSSEAAIRCSRLSHAESEHFHVDESHSGVNLQKKSWCGCCRRQPHPEDRGRCGRGTMVPISFGMADGEQQSLEEFLRKKQEKDMGGAVQGGFAV